MEKVTIRRENKMKKKGFTLIELLAVIVILAIVTYSIYKKDKSDPEKKSVAQETEDTPL